MATGARSSRFHDKPVVVGIFATIDEAQRAVNELLQAGFQKRQISVVCSDQEKEAHFREFERQEPAGFYTGRAVTGGALAGAVLGVLFALLVLMFAGQVEGLIAGLLLVPFGVVAGGFVGAMMTQGVEKEIANFYDQGVTPGNILVAAEDHSERADKTLPLAERIFDGDGVRPLELPEG
jgi:hypothetical protein